MSITSGFIDKDELNSTFVSKRATGSQIMAGSLRILGALTVDGAARVGSLTTDQLNVSTLTASETVTANLFSGSGASLTNLPAANLAGTIPNARLSSEVMLTNKTQTVSANLTMSSAANMYFAGGTTYYVLAAGDAKFKSLTTAGDITVTTNNRLVFQYTGAGAPADSSAGARISLQGSKHQIGIEANSIWYDSTVYHRFYTNTSTATRTERFHVSDTGVKVSGNALITENLEVEGEVKTGGINEFPDALLTSRSILEWGIENGTLVADSAQKPTGTNAVASIKITATAANAASLYATYLATLPNEWITFSAYLFATTAGKSAKLHICWYNASKVELSKSTTTVVAPTAWARHRITAQAPANAAFFRIQIDNDGGAGAIMYFTAFQVERGKALTPFKPYGGGEIASFMSKGIKLGSGGQIDSAYNNGYIFKDHANGNVTVSAAGGVVYLGYKNTTGVLLSANLKTAAGLPIASTEGILYYHGNDIDTRYLKTSGGGTIIGSLTIRSAGSPNFTIERSSLDYASVGAVFKNTAGEIHYGGFISATSKTFNIGTESNLNTAKFKVDVDTGEAKINNNVVWHAGNDGAGSGLDADTVDGVQLSSLVQTTRSVATGTGLSGGGNLNADRTISFDTTWGDARYLGKSAKAADADKLDGLDSESFLRSDANDTFTGTLTLNGKLNLTGGLESSGVPTMKDISGEHREGQKLNLLSRVAGRIVNKNADFIAGSLAGYSVYDNRFTGRVTINLVSDDTVPNANGKIMRVSYDPTIGELMPIPDFGGFGLVLGRDSSNLNTWGYRAGNRYLFRIIAKIPTGRWIGFGTNSVGDGYEGKWLTAQEGTNNWQEYLYLVTTGITGTFSSTGFFYVGGGTDTAFTWDVSICQMMGLDEVPDVDRAPTMNVGYKTANLGWGELYASGKITTDSDVEVNGKLVLKTSASMIQTTSGVTFINLQNSAGNVQIKTNEGNKTTYIDSDAIFLRKSDGTNRISLNKANEIILNDNVFARKNLSVDGNLVINKTGNSSKIFFQQQTSDEGLIEHYEDNNIARLYFAAGNETNDLDYMAFGSTVDREGAKITAAGRGTFKALTSNEELTVGGQTTFNGKVHFSTTDSATSKITFGTLGIGQVRVNSGEFILSGLTQLRFGSSTAWQWNQWAGIKYDSATSKLIIGGPASPNFDSNPNETKAHLSFEGLADAIFDGNVVINPTVTSSIGTTDLTQAYMLLGTPTSGLGLDPNEIAFVGYTGYVMTLDENNMILGTNKTERLRLSLTGAKVTGALDVTDTLTASSGISIPTAKTLTIGNPTNATRQLQFGFDGTDSIVNYGGKIGFFSSGVERFRITAEGRVGINTTPHATYHLHVPDMLSEGWIRTTGSNGWYSETWGGGWRMTDADWIRAYNGKGIYADTGTIRTDAKLQVGAAEELSVTPTVFNWRDTIYSGTAGKVSINKTTNSEHPLDVKSNGSFQGINIQKTAISNVSGLSYQNPDGKYTWVIASNEVENSGLSFRSGLNANQSSLAEVFKVQAAGGTWTSGDIVTNAKAMIRGGSGLTENASITLAVGDGDTGLDWVSSGSVRMMANNTETVRFTSGTVTVTPALLVNNNISMASSNGRGVRFWNSDSYKVYMSTTADTAWGGSIASAPTSDYNMYFRMTGSATRGFVFEGGQGKLAQIHGDGTIHAKTGFRNGNFEIMHNTTKDSLDFIYMG